MKNIIYCSPKEPHQHIIFTNVLLITGKAAYQGHLSDLLLKTVKNLKCGEDVKVLELLREINRQFAERDIDLGTYDDEDEYRSYEVKNIGSIVHCLTEHIVYRIK